MNEALVSLESMLPDAYVIWVTYGGNSANIVCESGSEGLPILQGYVSDVNNNELWMCMANNILDNFKQDKLEVSDV